MKSKSGIKILCRDVQAALKQVTHLRYGQMLQDVAEDTNEIECQ